MPDADEVQYRLAQEQQFLREAHGPLSCAFAFLMGVQVLGLLWLRGWGRRKRKRGSLRYHHYRRR